MKIIDLSHLLYRDMPVYPGTEPPSFQKICTLERDGFRETKLNFTSHVGTHVDAPGHMLNNGIYLENMNVEHFLGKATILNFENVHTLSIHLDQLMPYMEKISKVKFVI